MKLTTSKIIKLSEWCSVALGLFLGVTFLDPMAMNSLKNDVESASFSNFGNHAFSYTPSATVISHAQIPTRSETTLVLASR